MNLEAFLWFNGDVTRGYLEVTEVIFTPPTFGARMRSLLKAVLGEGCRGVPVMSRDVAFLGVGYR